jgi:tRNA(fMet)-specific endonuclease VapC
VRERFGSTRSRARCCSAATRKGAARSYDAMIAATALAHGLPVYTANPDDFEGIDGLEVVAISL